MIDEADLRVPEVAREQAEDSRRDEGRGLVEEPAGEEVEEHDRGGAQQRRQPGEPQLDAGGTLGVAAGVDGPGDPRQQPVEEGRPDGLAAVWEIDVAIEAETRRWILEAEEHPP